MASSKTTENAFQEARYIEFPSLPADAKNADGTPALNRYSANITKGHEFPGAKVNNPGNLDRTPLQSVAANYMCIFIGHALCCWSTEPRCYEQESTDRYCLSVVGGQSMQYAPVGSWENSEEGHRGQGNDRMAVQHNWCL